MIELAARWADGVEEIIKRNRLPWIVTVLGARAEYAFTPEVPVNGAQLAAAGDEHLERYLRIALINRGGHITTPFHNMALVSPATAVKDVDLHTRALDEAVTRLLSPSAAASGSSDCRHRAQVRLHRVGCSPPASARSRPRWGRPDRSRSRQSSFRPRRRAVVALAAEAEGGRQNMRLGEIVAIVEAVALDRERHASSPVLQKG